jgi:hypothetical protein
MQLGWSASGAWPLVLALLLGNSAPAAEPSPTAEASELTGAIAEFLASSSGEWLRPPQTRLPAGDYPLCRLQPATIFRNMIGGTPLAKDGARGLYAPWSGYLNAASAALARTERASTLNLLVRARMDGEIRQKIGEFGVAEPASPAMKHYQALLWAASCLIDRANTQFLGSYLRRGEWPSQGQPTDPSSPSHSLFLLIQHSVLSPVEQEGLIPLVEEAFRRGSVAPFDYARIIDRSTQSRLGYQKYGTQSSYLNGKGVIEGAVGCRDTLNKNRSTLGLDPLGPDVEARLQGGEVCQPMP